MALRTFRSNRLMNWGYTSFRQLRFVIDFATVRRFLGFRFIFVTVDFLRNIGQRLQALVFIKRAFQPKSV